MADSIEPVTHLENVIAGTVEPVTHLEHVIALYGGSGGSGGTDELVKMDSTTDAKYLSDLIDKSTVVNDNGVLKVKKLDGQEVTIAEINHLKGLTMNVMDLVNAFANGGVKVYERTMPTYADLLTLDRSGFIDEIKYFVYVQSDETHGGAKTTYLCDKTSEIFFGNADSQRNFITNPIDLANEVTGKLGISNIDVDTLWKLLTINDTYKTLTTKDEVFGTHGAKVLYDELVTDIGKKANATDLATHTNDTNIHVTTYDKTKWNEVDNKSTMVTLTQAEYNQLVADGTIDNDTYYIISDDSENIEITQTISSSSTKNEVPSAKAVYDKTKNMCTTTVTDVPVTKININASYISNAKCYYEVRNGICYVNFMSGIYIISSQLDGVTLATGLPKPNLPQVPHTYVLWAGSPSQQVILFVNNDGRLVLHAPVSSNGGCVFTSFSYPVKES